LINDYLNIAHDQIFTVANVPVNFTAVKSDFALIVKNSLCMYNELFSCLSSSKISTTQSTTTTTPATNAYRLPTNIKPNHYDLTLKVYFKPYCKLLSFISK